MSLFFQEVSIIADSEQSPKAVVRDELQFSTEDWHST